MSFITCTCGAPYQITPEYWGKQFQCTQCGSAVLVPPGGPPVSQYALPASDYSGDLSMKALVRMTIDAWKSNVVSRRLMMLIRRTAIALLCIILGGQLIGLASVAFGGVYASPGFGGTAFQIAVTAVTGLLGLVVFALTVTVPFLYPTWAWKKTWLEDPNLRLTDLPVRDRLIGMFVPIVAVKGAATAIALLFTPIQVLLSAFQMRGAGGLFAGGGWGMMLFGLTISTMIASAFNYPMICVTIGLRRIISEASPGVAKTRGSHFMAGPVVRIVLLMILVGFLRSLPMGALTAFTVASSTTPAAGGAAFPSFGVIGALIGLAVMVLVDVGSVFAFHQVLSPYWRKDLPLVRDVAFAADEGGTPSARHFGDPVGGG